jgi:hypothetical protein
MVAKSDNVFYAKLTKLLAAFSANGSAAYPKFLGCAAGRVRPLLNVVLVCVDT